MIKRENKYHLLLGKYYPMHLKIKPIELGYGKPGLAESVILDDSSYHAIIYLSINESIDDIKQIIKELDNINHLKGLSFRYTDSYRNDRCKKILTPYIINYILLRLKNTAIEVIDMHSQNIVSSSISCITRFNHLRILDIFQYLYRDYSEQRSKLGAGSLLKEARQSEEFTLQSLCIRTEGLSEESKEDLNYLIEKGQLKRIIDIKYSTEEKNQEMLQEIDSYIIPKLIEKHFKIRRYLDNSSKDKTNKLAVKLNNKYLSKLNNIYNTLHILIERCQLYDYDNIFKYASIYNLALYFYDLKKYDLVYDFCFNGIIHNSKTQPLAMLATTMIIDGYIEHNKSEIDKTISILWLACKVYETGEASPIFQVAQQNLSALLHLPIDDMCINYSNSPERILIELQMQKIKSNPSFEADEGFKTPVKNKL